MNVPRTIEHGERFRLVRRNKLLGTQRQDNIRCPGTNIGSCHVQCRASRRAGIFHIHDRLSLKPHGAENDFSAYHVLTFEMPLGAIAEECRVNEIQITAGIGTGVLGRNSRKVFERAVKRSAKPRHADSRDEKIAHFGPSAIAPPSHTCGQQ